MIPLNWTDNIKTSLSIFYDKALPLLEDYRIRLAVAAAFVVLSALFLVGVIRCIRGKRALKKSEDKLLSIQRTPSNTTTLKPEQVTTLKLQSLEEENQKLKKELQTAKQVHTANQTSAKNEAVESEMLSRIRVLETELLHCQSSLQENERKLTETKHELDTSKAVWGQKAQQSLKTQREQLNGAHQVKLDSLKGQIAAGQKPEDVKLLEQFRILLSLGPEVKLDRNLKKTIFGSKTSVPAEAQKLFDHLRRSKELNRLANTKPEDFNSPTFVPKAGIQESDQLTKNFKSLLIEIKSLKKENADLVKSNEILSAQNAKFSQKSEQKSMNVSQIKQADK